ncbi:MAG: hypothetical protein UU28_C0001G0003 [Parcubacteria group bacterium GW2011_GWD2_40_9]|nr:MAG: hypothetical protein UU28_C0001G0003 [Parcubacteria group bacterium GW2011_GWD2_40_9]
MAEQITTANFFYSLLGGFIPSVFWLWFWLKEDKKRPEPKKAIIFTFLAGMAAVPAAIGAEYVVSVYVAASSFVILLIWAFIEDILKFFAAHKTALSKKYYDEPIDAIVYMITAALGFASLENTLFIIKSLSGGEIFDGIDTSGIRFIGATLLHVATSAIVGASIAFSFFHKNRRLINLFFGILVAGTLHFLFNYFIILSGGQNILKIFMPLWIVIIILIFVFEKIKRIKK